ncbi:MAG: hypothetical protein ACLQFW_01085 [Xanthobacteraceae bacterium]
MYVAERNLQADDLARTFERYSKLTQETARQIIDYYSQRAKVGTQKVRGSAMATNP